MKDVDAEYYGYRDEDDGVLLPLEAQYEKQGTSCLLLLQRHVGAPVASALTGSRVRCRSEAVAEAAQKWRTEESQLPRQQEEEEEEESIYSSHHDLVTGPHTIIYI